MEGIDLDLKWKRPATVQIPTVWHTFETKPKDNVQYKIKIQDLTPDRFDEVIELMMKYYFPEEPLAKSSKLLEDEVSIQVYQFVLYKVMENVLSIVAVLDEDVPKPKIVGLQLLTVSSKEDSPLAEVPGITMEKMKKIYYDIRKNIDVFEILHSNKYLHEWGLCVVPEFRGLDVGYNILLSLEKICRTFGIDGSMIMFTSIQSQTLATRVGFKLYNEIVYDEYKDENGQVVFPVEGTKTLKFMGIKYE